MRINRLVGGVVVVAVLWNGSAWVAGSDSASVRFRWENWEASERPFLEEQRTALKTRGATVGEVEETEPSVKNPAAVWLVMAGVAALSVLAETIVHAVKDLNQCGLVVDAKGEETTVRRNCDLDHGEVLVRQPDGHLTKIEFKDKPSIDLVPLVELALTKGGKGK